MNIKYFVNGLIETCGSSKSKWNEMIVDDDDDSDDVYVWCVYKYTDPEAMCR